MELLDSTRFSLNNTNSRLKFDKVTAVRRSHTARPAGTLRCKRRESVVRSRGALAAIHLGTHAYSTTATCSLHGEDACLLRLPRCESKLTDLKPPEVTLNPYRGIRLSILFVHPPFTEATICAKGSRKHLTSSTANRQSPPGGQQPTSSA